ncbi:MAG: ATP-binding protein, partial [bacterium]|nr:ATP-binding protein [bacterium]
MAKNSNHQNTQDPESKDYFAKAKKLLGLPIPGLKAKLIRHSKENPEKAFDFIDYLRQNHPSRHTLTNNIIHAATSSLWSKYEFSDNALDTVPVFDDEQVKYKPSEVWMKKLEEIKSELAAARQQPDVDSGYEYYERSCKRLKEFKELNLLMEDAAWNHYYFDTLDQWIVLVESKLKRFEFTSMAKDAMVKNIYHNKPLAPGPDTAIFLGRKALMEDLRNKIAGTSLLLLQGAQGSGKTSVLNYLPGILGTGFKVVYMDLKAIGGIYDWLSQLKQAFDTTMQITGEKLPEPTGNKWIDTWKVLRKHLEENTQKEKVVLVFDNYDRIHYCLQKSHEEAKNLLGGLRNFCSFQDKVGLVFAGSSLFTQLKDPDWSTYFVEAVR